MLAEPIVFTVAGNAKSMPRVIIGQQSATYRTADGLFEFIVSHQTSKDTRVRTLAKITQRKIVVDPLTTVSDYDTCSVQVVIDRPEVGFSATDVNDLVAAFKTWLDSTIVTKLYGQES